MTSGGKFGVALHAYCLMGNHVHLLASPTDASGLARLMKALAGRATRYRNRLERRTGTLWEGRFRSSLVQSERYLLACSRYIELNPVRAGIVAEPLAYPWSSYPQRMGRAAAFRPSSQATLLPSPRHSSGHSMW